MMITNLGKINGLAERLNQAQAELDKIVQESVAASLVTGINSETVYFALTKEEAINFFTLLTIRIKGELNALGVSFPPEPA
jgi:hypothetical protein